MKKHFTLLTSLLFSIIVLTACNTAEDSTSAPVASENNTEIETNENNNAASEDNTETNVEENSDTEVEQNENSITYTSNGVEKSEAVTTVTSDQQNFSIKVLPTFTLTAEEPGKDLLFYNEDDSVSMRIEYLSVNDSTFEDLSRTAQDTLKAISEEIEQFDISSYIANNTEIEKHEAYIVDLESEVVLTVVYEKGDQLVRLTIFDKKTLDLKEAMIKMGLTISPKQ